MARQLLAVIPQSAMMLAEKLATTRDMKASKPETTYKEEANLGCIDAGSTGGVHVLYELSVRRAFRAGAYTGRFACITRAVPRANRAGETSTYYRPLLTIRLEDQPDAKADAAHLAIIRAITTTGLDALIAHVRADKLKEEGSDE